MTTVQSLFFVCCLGIVPQPTDELSGRWLWRSEQYETWTVKLNGELQFAGYIGYRQKR